MRRKALLSCGILSSLHYGAMIILIRFEGYNPLDQTVSELSAVGAPTAPLWAQLGPVYNVLLAAFAVGVWLMARRQRSLRAVAGLLLLFAMLGAACPFAAMHQREVLAEGGGTFADTLHQILGVITVLLMPLIMGVGAAAFSGWFRRYSLASILVQIPTGILVGMAGPEINANLPTPWVGLWQRINILAFLSWVAVLAIVLIRAGDAPGRNGRTDPPG